MSRITEVWADEIITPDRRHGVKRFNPARLLISSSGRVRAIEKISRAKLKTHSKKILRARSVIPGLIDAHTHLVFSGNRAGEWGERLRGVSYQSIAMRGGGILKTLSQTREASSQELSKLALIRLKNFLSHGVTSLEIKSGYGLSVESELKILQVIRQLKARVPQRIFSTFMGAHAVPKEFKNSKVYTDYLIEKVLPRVRGLADFQDVFCEEGYFSKSDSLRLLKAGLRYGLAPKVHAHEFARSGGVDVAAKVRAVSADHLMQMSDVDIAKLKRSNVVPVLLPGTSFFLGAQKFADGKKFFDRNLEPAIASDFNPGTNPSMNLPLCGTMAAIFYGLSLEQVLRGQTVNAARALGCREMGVLAPGYWADFVCLEADHFEEIYYSYGNSLVASVYIAGQQVY